MLTRSLRLVRTYSFHRIDRKQHARTAVCHGKALALYLPARTYSQEFTALGTTIVRRIQDIASTLHEIRTSLSREATEQSQLSLRELQAEYSQIQELAVLAETDAELLTEMLEDADRLQAACDNALRKHWLSGPHDNSSAYLDIHAGSGGTDACDWAAMLVRMYTKWAYSQNYTVDLISETAGDSAGVKSSTLLVRGQYAYGYAQYETGVHRLVRTSPFDPKGARHTSFASVRVSPHIEAQDMQDMSIKLHEADLKITTMRSQGPGGQHVNKTESAVRIEHLPSGITVACQRERQQSANRNLAMDLLKSELYEIELRKRERSKADVHSQLPDISWGSQIRSYVLHPYRLVKDARSGHEVSGNKQVDAVLDGDIMGFMMENLRRLKRGQ